MNEGKRGLLLDFGGVISVTLFERHRTSERLLGLKDGTLNWRGPFDPGSDSLWRDMVAGKISERDYWARRAHETGRLIGEDWDMLAMIQRTMGDNPNLHVRPEALDLVQRAKAAGKRVGILSNELELFYGADAMRRLDILRLMDRIVDATHTKILKPDPRSYAFGCETLGLRPQDIVFVDDQVRNVDGARKAGLTAIAFDVARPSHCFAEAAAALGLGGARL
ncbi:MAG: HAD-IA family hydrolase [Hyphomicrobiales bacterium]|nr:HAD-IA family hydrolase [Hyphomicrobiales bacterium]